MAYKQAPINFGIGTGSSPLNDNGENEPGKGRSWDNPTGPHIDEQIKKYGGPREMAPGPRVTDSAEPKVDSDSRAKKSLAEDTPKDEPKS